MVDEYFREVGIIDASSIDEIYAVLEKQIGKDGVEELERIVDSRADGKNESDIYKLMNKTLEGSITFFGGFDSAWLRKTLRLIEKYKNEYGKEVLDVGCNNGIVTCFIAKCCPDAHVVGIDIEPASVAIARQLAAKLNLTNVEFRVCDFLKSDDQQYDSVFMFKTIQEMVGIDLTRKAASMSFFELGEYFAKKFNRVAKIIAKRLKQGGTFFSVERIPYTIATYGYCCALTLNDVHPDMSKYKKVVFKGVCGTESMPFVFAKRMRGNQGEILDKFTEILSNEMFNS